jgi:pyruvate dehydrogenase E2 component (dihydrolipoamide acetyltransferase)
MALEIRVPEVAEGVDQGMVVAVAVAKGDRVEADQTLIELETDKAVVAIPSPQAGTITDIKVKEGDKVKVGAVIMLIDAEGAEAEPETTAEPEPEPAASVATKAEASPEADPEPTATPEPKTATEPEPKRETKQEPAPAKVEELDLSTPRRGDQVAPAAPSVRRIARDLGVDIYQVQGTGPGGRISEKDLRHYVKETMKRFTGGGAPVSGGQFPGLHAQRPLPDFSRWGKVTREPLSRVRELTADAMGYAWSTIPMVTQYDQARVTEIEKYRIEFNAKAADDAKLTMTAILVKICAEALRTFPQFNSSLDLASKELVLKQSVHIGVAVDTPRGLLVPVLKDADHSGLEKLAIDLNTIAAKTREQKITPADMEGGTFTISNLGGIGGTNFTPIVYAPQVAILGVSRTQMQPVWDGRTFKPQQIMPLSLTYDHRVIDGADGARFLRWICATLENPLQLVMKG